MAWITDHTDDIWKSGAYVGENTPKAVVQVQLGRWARGWYRQDELAFPTVNARIWGEGGYGEPTPFGTHELPQAGHWSPKWEPASDWKDVPNLQSIKRTRDGSDRKMLPVIEIVLDAQDYVDKVGALGDAYHVIEPGWLAPTRNYVPPMRGDPGWETNEWAPEGDPAFLTDGVRIRVWQGYGEPETSGGNCPPTDGGTNGAWTLNGMVDDVDLDGNPNTITIIARGGKLLTDQHIFRAAKSLQIPDPITFYDELAAQQLALVGSGAKASSSRSGYPAKNVLDTKGRQFDGTAERYRTWWKGASGSDDWVEIRLPQGRYRYVWVALPDPVATTANWYVGVYARRLRHHVILGDEPGEEIDDPTIDGAAVPEGWIDLGNGNPPGTTGAGWTWIAAFTPSHTGYRKVDLGHTVEVGKHSILRLFADTGPVVVSELHALRGIVQKEVRRQKFILVDDASEVVKVVLRWAGFQTWDVEEAGVRLSDGTNYGPGVVAKAAGRLSFARKDMLIDIIADVGKQLGFIFFLADPVDGDSWGVPTFRRDSSLLLDNNYVVADLNERTMLTGLKTKGGATDEDRPTVIRVRGKTASARHGGESWGMGDAARIMATYWPPWGLTARTGGVMRYINYQDDQLITYAMCLYGAVLIALNAAVAMYPATAEIPAHLVMEIDDQVYVLDEATATNGRMWVTKTEDTMTLGQNASWKMTLQGALIDTKDMHDVLDEAAGNAAMTVGKPSGNVIIPSIDWRHVVNPVTGEVTGYRSPVSKKSAGRTIKRKR